VPSSARQEIVSGPEPTRLNAAEVAWTLDRDDKRYEAMLRLIFQPAPVPVATLSDDEGTIRPCPQG